MMRNTGEYFVGFLVAEHDINVPGQFESLIVHCHVDDILVSGLGQCRLQIIHGPIRLSLGTPEHGIKGE